MLTSRKTLRRTQPSSETKDLNNSSKVLKVSLPVKVTGIKVMAVVMAATDGMDEEVTIGVMVVMEDSSNAEEVKVKTRKVKEMAAHGKNNGETREQKLFQSQLMYSQEHQVKQSLPRLST